MLFDNIYHRHLIFGTCFCNGGGHHGSIGLRLLAILVSGYLIVPGQFMEKYLCFYQFEIFELRSECCDIDAS